MNKYLISYSYVRYNPNGSRSGIASGNTSVNAASESEAREIVQSRYKDCKITSIKKYKNLYLKKNLLGFFFFFFLF